MRYVVEKNGRLYFQATKRMREAGIFSEALPTVGAKARWQQLMTAWDEARQAQPEPERGDFNDLIAMFQKDPVWYGKLAKATQAEMDYAFTIIAEQFGPHRVTALQRRHCRVFYNRLRVEGSAHKAHRVLKCFRRLLNYAVEMGVREFNPALGMSMESLPGRNQIWTPEQVSSFVSAAISGGKAESGNKIPPRPSLALAVSIALCTAQREQDVLALTWNQFDGEGIELTQKKTGKRLWVPLDRECLAMMPKERTSTHIIVSEETKRPYSKDAFTRIFRKFARRAGIPDDLQFRDLRRTAATELGNSGATETEIASTTGHTVGSNVLKIYVKPDKRAARRAARKRDK